MRCAKNWFVLLIIDALDEVSLLAHASVGKDGVSGGKIFQIRFERTDVDRWPVRSILGKTERGGDFLHSIQSRELTDAHAHCVARMDKAVRARQDAAVDSIGISRGPISGAFNFPTLNRAVADSSARQQPMGESERVNEGLKSRTDLPICRGERPIEFALRVIAATDERANASTCVVDRHNRAFQIWHRRIPLSVLRPLIICFQRMMKIGLMLDFRELSLE